MNIWSILCLIWTLAAYVVAKRIYQKNPKLWLSPAISVPVLTIILMTVLEFHTKLIQKIRSGLLIY